MSGIKPAATQRRATPRDVHLVFGALSEASLADVATHFDSIPEARKLAKERCREKHAYVILEGEAPVAVYGAVLVGDHLETWMYYTERFYGIHEAASAFIRDMAAGEGRPVEVHSILFLPKSKAWLESLGFTATGKSYESANGIPVQVFRRAG